MVDLMSRKGRTAVPTTEIHSDDSPISSSQAESSPTAADDTAAFDPHAAEGGTVNAAIFGIIKAMVGPAILYLPHSFADAGYLFALVTLLICLLMYLYSSNRLLQTWYFVKSQQAGKTRGGPRTKSEDDQVEMVSLTSKSTDTTEASSSEVDDQLFKKKEDATKNTGPNSTNNHHGSINYPHLAKLAYDDIGETLVRAGITSMQLGICLTYFIFVPHNLSASIYTLFGVRVKLWVNLVVMVLVEIPLSSIRDIRKLVRTNVLANALIGFGLASCLYLAIFVAGKEALLLEDENEQDAKFEQELSNATLELHHSIGDGKRVHTHHLSPWNDHWYLFIGTSVLLFEGSITLCLPLQEALQGPEAGRKFPQIYNRTISCIVLFYSFFGMVCWTAFGDEVNTVLTTSLPEGFLATTVQLAYSVAVIFTFPLQFFPSLEIIVHVVEQRLFPNNQNSELSRAQRLFVVAIVIILLSIVGVIEMDNLGRVVSLMGSLLGVPLAFIFPPLIHSQVVPSAPKQMNAIVAGAGFLAMVGATFTTLATWNEGSE